MNSHPLEAHPLVFFFYLVFIVLMLASLWRVHKKAGFPGWGCLVPFYNLYVLMKIAGKPDWQYVLFLIPLVNLYMIVATNVGIAKNFGKSAGFGWGLVFLGPVFSPILGFGEAQYRPGAGAAILSGSASSG